MTHNLNATEIQLKSIFDECVSECQKSVQEAMLKRISDYMNESQQQMFHIVDDILNKSDTVENAMNSFNASRDLILDQFREQNAKYLKQEQQKTNALYMELHSQFKKFKMQLLSNNEGVHVLLIAIIYNYNILVSDVPKELNNEMKQDGDVDQ